MPYEYIKDLNKIITKGEDEKAVAPGPDTGQQSIDMNTRNVQSGGHGGSPGGGANLERTLRAIPGNVLGSLSNLYMPVVNRAAQVGTEIVKSGAEVVAKTVLDTGGKAAGGVLERLLGGLMRLFKASLPGFK